MKNKFTNILLLLIFSSNILLAADKLPPKLFSDVDFSNELKTIKGKKYQENRLYGKKLHVTNPSSYINDHNRIWSEFIKFEKQMHDDLSKNKTIEIEGETKIYFRGLQSFYVEYEGIKDNEEIWSLYFFAPSMVGTEFFDQYPPQKMYEIKIDTDGGYTHITRLDTDGYYANGKINMAGWEMIDGTKIALVETYSMQGKTTKYLHHQNETTAEIKIDFNEGEKEIDIIFNRKTGAGKYRHPDVETGKWLCWNAEMSDVDCGNFSLISDFENFFQTEKQKTSEVEVAEDNSGSGVNYSQKRVIENKKLGYTISLPNDCKINFAPINDGITGSLKATTKTLKEEEDWTGMLIYPKGEGISNITIYMTEEKDAYSYDQIKTGMGRHISGYNFLKNPKIINEAEDFEIAGLKGYLFLVEHDDGKAQRYMFQHLDGTSRVSIQFNKYEPFESINNFGTSTAFLQNINITKN